MSIPLKIAFLASLLGMIDIMAKLFYVDSINALVESAHDPGKAMFHVILLPTALYLIFNFLYSVDFKDAFLQLKRYINLAIIFVLTVLVIVISYSDSQKGFFERDPMPWDFSNSRLSKITHDYRVDGWSKILKFNGKKAEEKVLRKEILNGYRELLLKEGIRDNISFSNYIKSASVKKYIADILTLLGILSAALLIGILSISSTIRHSINANQIKYLYLAFSVMATWIPFRIYSEWHGNFGYEFGSNDGVFIGILSTLLIGYLFFLFERPATKPIITASSITLFCTIIGTTVAIEPKYFENVAILLSKSPLHVLITLYGLIIIAFLSSIGSALVENKNI